MIVQELKIAEVNSELYVSLEDIRVALIETMSRMGERQVSIKSYDHYSESTFLAFDSYNIGLESAKSAFYGLESEIDYHVTKYKESLTASPESPQQ